MGRHNAAIGPRGLGKASRPLEPNSLETPRTHRDDIVIRRGEGRRPPPPPPVEDFHEDVINLEHDRGRHGHEDHERIQVRHRSASRPRAPPKGLVQRENEEIVIRRRKPRSVSSISSSPSPPPARRNVREEQIIIRRKEERSPSPLPPPPEPEPIEPEPPVRPPIVEPELHQRIVREIVTHHRHIDHGELLLYLVRVDEGR